MEGTYIIGASEWVTFDASESADDSEITLYEWDFGNGDAAVGSVVQYRYTIAGIYNVVLTVTDDDGDSSSYVQQVTVFGNSPCGADDTGGGTCS